MFLLINCELNCFPGCKSWLTGCIGSRQEIIRCFREYITEKERGTAIPDYSLLILQYSIMISSSPIRMLFTVDGKMVGPNRCKGGTELMVGMVMPNLDRRINERWWLFHDKHMTESWEAIKQ